MFSFLIKILCENSTLSTELHVKNIFFFKKTRFNIHWIETIAAEQWINNKTFPHLSILECSFFYLYMKNIFLFQIFPFQPVQNIVLLAYNKNDKKKNIFIFKSMDKFLRSGKFHWV